MSRNIYAFTAPGADFPGFISVNHPMPGEPEGISVHVRSGGRDEHRSGAEGEITLNRKDARALGLALIQATN